MGLFKRPKVTILPSPKEEESTAQIAETEAIRQQSFASFLNRQSTLGVSQLSAGGPGLQFKIPKRESFLSQQPKQAEELNVPKTIASLRGQRRSAGQGNQAPGLRFNSTRRRRRQSSA